ncbi:MAG: CinA family nicotinamide mononucleotide deamidase-related protein [Thermodesulfobacteriota bacterium]|nr:CinA family nicotinamide mononucleotide deamidase-related protein [Thermodesulfobacteriota bacterium]
MQGEIITIGNELTSGRTLDSNSHYAAGRLTSAGLHVIRMTCVGDDSDMVTCALKQALESSRFVIVTGGLGPTDDDMTNEIVAKALDRPLTLNQEMSELLKRLSKARGLEMTPSVEKMAWMPKGSKALRNKHFSCGFSLKEKDVHLYFLPGVSSQMRHLMDTSVLPDILSRHKNLPATGYRILKTYGLGEPAITEAFKKLQGKTGQVVFGFYPHGPENHITMSLKSKNEPEVLNTLDRIEAEIRSLLGAFIFAAGNEKIEDIAGKILSERHLTLSVAESCTGGLIGNRLTNVPGSSRYFKGGVIVYSNEAKENLLNVRSETLRSQGAVSDMTASEMAVGVRERLQTDLGLAATGIAGPTGGSKEKPLGTVYIGLASAKGVFSGHYRFWGSREQIKTHSSTMALDWIRRHLCGYPYLPGL